MGIQLLGPVMCEEDESIEEALERERTKNQCQSTQVEPSREVEFPRFGGVFRAWISSL